MNRLMHVLFGAAGLAAVLSPETAVADDAYVCDGGRLVYARPETLEKLKAADPCVARYHMPAGTQIAPAAMQRPAAAISPAPALPEPAPAGVRPQPFRDAAAKREPSKPVALKPAVAATPKVAAPKPKPAEAATGTDFRNVRVINAQEQGTLYRHDR